MPNTHINILKGNLSTNNKEIKGSLTLPERVATSNYNELFNKPQINSVELIGNKISEELGLEPTIHDISEQDIDNLIYGG